MEGVKPGYSHTVFHQLIEAMKWDHIIHGLNYNGELVGIMECRQDDGFEEVHAVWFTESKRKRAILMKECIRQKKDKWVTFVHPEESDGHFALARRGLINFVGQDKYMNNIFQSWQ